MTAQPALPLHMCPMAYILSADCVSPVADAWPKCAYQQWPGELASSSSRARVGAVSPFVYSLRATASRPSPIPTACDYVSLPTQSRRTLYSSCSHCARLRLARRRCRAHACLPARFNKAWRACVMCTCGRCLAFSLNVITIPFVFKRVHMHATSHQPVHMFLQACCTCMLSACDCIPARVFTRTRRVPAGLKTRCSRLRAARRRCPAAACMPVLLAS